MAPSLSGLTRVDDLIRDGVLAVNDGYRVRNVELGPEGIPFVRGGDIGAGQISTDVSDHIRPELADRVQAKLTQPYDVAFITKGTVGRVGMLQAGQPQVVFAPQVCYWRSLDHDRLDPRFLFYLLQSAEFQANLNAVKTHGSMAADYVSIRDQRDFRLTIPAIKRQREIAEILGALDDKIELNRRMNATLEAMARALFQSWFVDFDPVRAGAEQLISEGTLEVGDGYRAKNSELEGPGLPFVRAGNLKDGFELASAEILNEVSVARAGSKVSRPGDVAFTSKGTIGRIARVSELDPQFVYSPQICYWRSLDPSRLEPTILYCWMQSLDFRSQVDAVAGQTDMAPYVSLRDQRAMEVPIFPESQRALARRLELLLSRQFHAGAESARLASLRDTLLPNLLRGDLAAGCVDRPSNTSSTSISSTTGITNKRNSTTSTTTTQQHSSTVSRP